MLAKTYKLVQFSVQIAGLFGELGPTNVSPHVLPLHVFICTLLKFQFSIVSSALETLLQQQPYCLILFHSKDQKIAIIVENKR